MGSTYCQMIGCAHSALTSLHPESEALRKPWDTQHPGDSVAFDSMTTPENPGPSRVTQG
jgi:hypothetical protein